MAVYDTWGGSWGGAWGLSWSREVPVTVAGGWYKGPPRRRLILDGQILDATDAKIADLLNRKSARSREGMPAPAADGPAVAAAVAALRAPDLTPDDDEEILLLVGM